VEKDLAAVSDLLKRHQLAAAREALSSLVHERPEDPELADMLAELLLLERSPEAAVQAARQALRLGGESADRLDRLGRCLNNLGELGEAERVFRQALSHDPSRAETCTNLGHVLRRQRRLGEAEEALLRALEMNPGHTRALRTLGMIRLVSGEPAEAARLLRQALQNDPGEPGLLGHLGIALHRSGDLEAAEGAYRAALEKDDTNTETWMNLGITLQEAGHLEEAIRVYESAGTRSPTNAAPRHRLAEALLIAGKPERALAIAEEAETLDPGHPTGVAIRIVALQALRRDDEARRLLGLDTLIDGVDLECPPGYPNLKAFNRALANHVLTHPTLSFEPEGHATRRGRHTRDLLMDEKGPVAILEDAVIRAVDGYLQRRTPVADHPFPGSVPRRHRLTMWAVVMETEGHQLPHIHPSAWLSGVYYVQLPETLGSRQEDAAGWIEFGLAPDELRSSPDMPVRLVEPVEGRMYLFPSYLYHRTIPFPGDHRRISIAFDVLRRPAG
jgi:Flp pilus assembly protein TadD